MSTIQLKIWQCAKHRQATYKLGLETDCPYCTIDILTNKLELAKKEAIADFNLIKKLSQKVINEKI
jgi:hypothetical protein